MGADFSQMYGNAQTITRLCRSIREKRVPHAYLICGAKGSGRHTLIKEMCAALNCEKKDFAGQTIPCQICRNCRRIYDGQYPDIKTIERPEGKATLGVDDIRSFREDVYLSPTESVYKIYIFEEADTMTVQAQNALLKVLEEPPIGVIIFLIVSSVDPILITIRSRVQRINMEPLSDALVRSLLLKEAEKKGLTLSDEEVSGAVCAAEGILGKAKELISPKASESTEKNRQIVNNLFRAIRRKAEYADILSAVNALPTKRQEFAEVMAICFTALRDIIISKTEESVPPLFFLHAQERDAIAAKLSQKEWMRVAGAMTEAQDKFASMGNVNLILTELADTLYRQNN